MESIQHLEDAGVWDWKTYVIMPDHVHLVVELSSGNLSLAVNNLGKFTARRINSILGRRGTFWQHGFYEHCLRSEKSLWAHVAYILENPVRAGLAERWEDWPFSGAPRNVTLHRAVTSEGTVR
jgi:REP element-mobilizing transposase RayT